MELDLLTCLFIRKTIDTCAVCQLPDRGLRGNLPRSTKDHTVLLVHRPSHKYIRLGSYTIYLNRSITDHAYKIINVALV
jgi:hypothetical protein